MSFLGIAFEMSAIDVGMETGVGNAIKNLDVINQALSNQVNIIKNIRIKDAYDKFASGAQKAANAIKGFDLDNVTDKVEEFAIRADDALIGLEKKWDGISSRFKAKSSEMFAPLMKQYEKVRRLNKAIGDSYQMVIGKRLDEVKKKLAPVIDGISEFGKRGMDAAKRVGDGFKKFAGGISEVKDNFSKMMSSMQNRAQQFNVASIASNMKALTGETGNLTNSLEAQMVGMQQTTKPIISELDLTSKQIKTIASRAASVAYSMNTDAGSVANTMKAMAVANDGASSAMKKMGMTERDWIKVTQTTGMEMVDITSILGDLTESWGASDEAAGSALDEMLSIGKQAGTGLGPLKNMKPFLDALGVSFESLPSGMERSGEEILSLVKSTGKLSKAFLDMGEKPEAAVEMAQSVGKAFADQTVEMDKAFAIGGKTAVGEIPLVKQLATVTGSMDKAQEILRVGSRDAVAGIQMINDVFIDFDDGTVSAQRKLSDLRTVLGDIAPGMSYMAGNVTKGNEALKAAAAIIPKADQSLKQFGKDAYSSGLTLQDTFDRAKLAFETTFRSISRGNVRKLVGQQIKGMQDAGKELKEWGKEDGVLGTIVRAASQFDQMGIGGIFAEIAESSGIGAREASKLGTEYGVIFDTVNKVAGEFAPLMQMFGMTGPLGPLIAGGGIAALFMMSDDSAKDALGPFYKKFKELKKKATEIWDEWAPKIWKIWTTEIVPKIKKTWSESILPVITEWWNTSFVPFVKTNAPILGAAIADAVKWGWNALKSWEGWPGVAEEILNTVKSVLGKVWEWVGKEFGVGGQVALAVVGLGKIFGGTIAGNIAESMAGGGVASSFGGQLVAFLKGPAGLVLAAGALGAALGTAIWSVIDSAQKKVEEGANQTAKATQSFTNSKITGMSEKGLKAELANYKKLQESSVVEDIGNFIVGASDDAARERESASYIVKQIEDEMKRRKSGGKYGAELFEIQAREREKELDTGRSTMAPIDDFAVPSLPMTPAEFTPSEDVLASANKAGLSVPEEMSKGFITGADKLKSDIDSSLEKAVESAEGQSPPKVGPLSGELWENGAFVAGYSTMEQFAMGIADGVDMIKTAVETTLNDAVIATMEAYSTKMSELAAQKTFLADVAKSMVRDIGGSIETTVDAENDVNVRKNFETAMSLPGLAAVTLAIVNEGSMTRKVLAKILTEAKTQTDLMKGGGSAARPATVS